MPPKLDVATSADIDSISETLKPLDTPHYHFSGPDIIEPSINAKLCWVARKDGIIQVALVAREVEGGVEIVALAVKSPFQQRGIGRQLLLGVESRARDLGFPKIWCWSLARYASKDFYLSNGFTEAFLLKSQFYGEDCWFLGKLMTQGSLKWPALP